MKYIKRILALPFVMGVYVIPMIFQFFKKMWLFILHGGEFITYRKGTKTIHGIYHKLENAVITVDNTNKKLDFLQDKIHDTLKASPDTDENMNLSDRGRIDAYINVLKWIDSIKNAKQ